MDDHSDSQFPAPDSDARLAHRLFMAMTVAALLGALLSLIFASWRVTTGLLLGGGLSLLNFYWMRTSITAAFTKVEDGIRPRIRIAQYVLRYFLVGAIVYTAYTLNLVSLPATVVGLSSFVIALFSEALRETYFIIIRREGIN